MKMPIPFPTNPPPTAALFTDIDGTLLLDTDSPQPGLPALKALLAARAGRFLFAVVTGRRLEQVRQVFAEFDVPHPDLVIASVGTEIHHGIDDARPDPAWARHLDHCWDARAILAAVAGVPGLRPQPPENQNPFKVSFTVVESEAAVFQYSALETALGPLRKSVNVILTQNAHLDILPHRASKGRAVRYACRQLGLSLDRIVVCGDSGNDLDMLAETGQAVAVGNFSPELEALRGHPNVYFSAHPAAAGILDGWNHYGLTH